MLEIEIHHFINVNGCCEGCSAVDDDLWLSCSSVYRGMSGADRGHSFILVNPTLLSNVMGCRGHGKCAANMAVNTTTLSFINTPLLHGYIV